MPPISVSLKAVDEGSWHIQKAVLVERYSNPVSTISQQITANNDTTHRNAWGRFCLQTETHHEEQPGSPYNLMWQAEIQPTGTEIVKHRIDGETLSISIGTTNGHRKWQLDPQSTASFHIW